jgi:hypothetical protein
MWKQHRVWQARIAPERVIESESHFLVVAEPKPLDRGDAIGRQRGGKPRCALLEHAERHRHNGM